MAHRTHITHDRSGQKTVVLSDRRTGNIKLVSWMGNRASMRPLSIAPNLDRNIFDGDQYLDVENHIVREGKIIDRFNPDLDVFNRKDAFSVLFMRRIGLGDAIICAALARHIKINWPQAKITFNVPDKWKELFGWVDGIDAVLDCPVRNLPIKDYDAAFRLDGVFDMQRDSALVSRPALLFRYMQMGTPLAAMSQSWIKVPFYAENMARNWLRENDISENKKLIGIQIDSATPMRTIPPDIRNHIIAGLLENKDVAVIQFGLTTSAPSMKPLAYKGTVSAANAPLPLTAALMNMCSLMITPDSGLMHLSCALGRPTIALFGTVKSKLRTEFYPTAYPIEAEDPGCGKFPCNDMANNEGWGLGYCYDQYSRGSLCMRKISAVSVLKKASELLELEPPVFADENVPVYVLEMI